MDAGLTQNQSNSLFEPIDPLRGMGVALKIKAGSFAWDLELKAEDLHNINIRADAGMYNHSEVVLWYTFKYILIWFNVKETRVVCIVLQ